MVARSGGLPPCTAVARTVTMLSPAGLYLTVTSGHFCLKPSRTAWIDFCSVATQMPMREMDPEPQFAPPVEPAAPVLPPPPPPQPAASASAANNPSSKNRNLIRCPPLGVGRRRCRDLLRGRRNGGRVCRPRPRRSPLLLHASGGRNAPPWSCAAWSLRPPPSRLARRRRPARAP